MDVVGNDELLYRRIPFEVDRSFYYSRMPDGTVRISSTAFGDRNRRISVDRALLRDFDPTKTQNSKDDGVVTLLTGSVRSNSVMTYTQNAQPLVTHLLDVEPAPLPENAAHAEIVANPEIASGSTFKRLCELLARLAEWTIYPADSR